MGQVETFSYDAVGNVKTRTDFKGQITSYDYDSSDVFNRLIQETKPSGEVLEYSYDAAGNKTQLKVTYQDLTTRIETSSYDELNRLATVTDADLKVTSYGYDLNGNRESISYVIV